MPAWASHSATTASWRPGSTSPCGSKVALPDGRTVKALELSGQSNLLFRRNSLTGTVEVVARQGTGIELNAVLHAN